MIGAVLAIASAVIFGLNSAIVRRGVRWAPPYQLTVFSLTAATPVFVVLALVTGQADRAGELARGDYGFLVLAGMLNFVGGRYSNFMAIQAIGANLTAPVRSLSTLGSAALGFTLLNEEITVLRIVGIGLLVFAPLIAFSKPSQMRIELKSGRPLELVQASRSAALRLCLTRLRTSSSATCSGGRA